MQCRAEQYRFDEVPGHGEVTDVMIFSGAAGRLLMMSPEMTAEDARRARGEELELADFGGASE